MYVTAGTGLDPKLVTLANDRKLTVLVSWMPDKGKDGTAGSKYSLSAVAKGTFDQGLRALGAQLGTLKKSAIVRPMPEPNTPGTPGPGAAKGNSAATYVKAWKHVRSVLRKADPKVRLLWAPYARSVPDTPQNTIASYFPGAKYVDLVGASAANFGTTKGLAWSTPSRALLDRVLDDRGPRARSPSGSPRPVRPRPAATSAAGSSRSARCAPRCRS